MSAATLGIASVCPDRCAAASPVFCSAITTQLLSSIAFFVCAMRWSSLADMVLKPKNRICKHKSTRSQHWHHVGPITRHVTGMRVVYGWYMGGI